MGLQHYTLDMSKIPLKYHKKVLFYTKYTHPTLIWRGTHGRTDGRTENIYSIFRDKLLLLGEHELVFLIRQTCLNWFKKVDDRYYSDMNEKWYQNNLISYLLLVHHYQYSILDDVVFSGMGNS